jgi:copper transporter 1
MLWNWYTIDSCFLARSWHVTSKGMFAGSVIGVFLLVIAIESVRRLGREYDRYLVREATAGLARSGSVEQGKVGTPSTESPLVLSAPRETLRFVAYHAMVLPR